MLPVRIAQLNIACMLWYCYLTAKDFRKYEADWGNVKVFILTLKNMFGQNISAAFSFKK